MSFKNGIREFGEKAEEALTKELQQSHLRETDSKIHSLKKNGKEFVKQQIQQEKRKMEQSTAEHVMMEEINKITSVKKM